MVYLVARLAADKNMGSSQGPWPRLQRIRTINQLFIPTTNYFKTRGVGGGGVRYSR
jgi:hypothetical protein